MREAQPLSLVSGGAYGTKTELAHTIHDGGLA
jgi:hypothetical protein